MLIYLHHLYYQLIIWNIYENKKNNKKKNTEYRLYRKTPVKNKNSIYDTMQLIVE